MPGPGPYGNKKPAAKARQERRRRIATKVARKQSRLLPNSGSEYYKKDWDSKTYRGDAAQFQKARNYILTGGPGGYGTFRKRVKDYKRSNRILAKKKRMDGAYRAIER